MDITTLIEEGKIKRLFQVRNKIVFEGGIYHITQRAPGREPLYIEEQDYLYMLHLIKECSNKFSLDVFSFALMPNHIHLLLRLNKANLPEAMKNLFETYAKDFNKKYERKGPVFCKPYRAALCLDESYLLASSIYIHLNPVKAGLVQNPAEYRWSSYSLYDSDINPKTFLNYQFILKILDEDIQDAKRLYRKLISDTRKIKIEDVLENPKGLEIFRKNISDYIKKIFTNRKTDDSPKTDILNEEALEREITELTKKQRLRKPQEIQARKFLIEQLKSRGFSASEIAKKMNTSRQTVYQILNLTKRASLNLSS
jgi:putative transposase